MKDVQDRQITRLDRVREFATAHLSEDRRLDALRARLDAAAIRLQALRTAQSTARAMLPADPVEIRPLREALRKDHLARIRKAGKVLLKWAPGAERAMGVPKKRASTAALLEAADRMLAYLPRCAKVFVANGYPRDFVANLRAATSALRERTSRSGTFRRALTLATARIKPVLEKANKDVIFMGVLLHDRLRDDPLFATGWRQASRVERKKGRPRQRRPRRAARDSQE